jgi:hypothetical protein
MHVLALRLLESSEGRTPPALGSIIPAVTALRIGTINVKWAGWRVGTTTDSSKSSECSLHEPSGGPILESPRPGLGYVSKKSALILSCPHLTFQKNPVPGPGQEYPRSSRLTQVVGLIAAHGQSPTPPPEPRIIGFTVTDQDI